MKAHAEWWEARIARQKEIDASIAAKAEFEYLYDKPYVDNSRIRVAGPFTVESLSPHRTLAVDWDDELIDMLEAAEGKRKRRGVGRDEAIDDFAQMILENLKVGRRPAGAQGRPDRLHEPHRLAWPITSAPSGAFMEGDKPKRAGVFVGPEFGTVSRPDLVAAAREAGDAGFDVLIACAFNYDAHSAEFDKLGRVPVLKARMNPDLHMGGDLKATGAGNLFVIFGEPDIGIETAEGRPTAGQGVRRRRVQAADRRGRVGGHRRHRALDARRRLQRGKLLRPPRLFPRRQRPLQGAEDDAEGRDRRGSLGEPLFRHLAARSTSRSQAASR